MSNICIHWFRQDLRIVDNPALFEAAKNGAVLPVYILDDKNARDYSMGAASRWWLHHSLNSLNQSLNGKLSVYNGQPENVLPELARKYKVKAIFWNRCYEPWRIKRDQNIKEKLKADNTEVHSFNGSLLWEPWEALKADKTPYRVFTAFYKNGCFNATRPRQPLPSPKDLSLYDDSSNNTRITDLGLLTETRWDQKLEPHWKIGEKAAHERLADFLAEDLYNYREGRNFPAKPSVSRLSPYLHFGEISPNQVWYETKASSEGEDPDHFCRELGWREFSNNLLYYNPELPHTNLQSKFNNFPWRDDSEALRLWQKGKTGYPIVDAGMRELWQTGYMHNRIRMVVGSFLVKNLLLHWHHGERWFWDCLVDADLANNSAGWQWIAGCGADAAPYFRIFNPVTQGRKFDPDGKYTRQFIPELKDLPNKYLFNPWEAPEEILTAAGIKLGQTYPEPIVNLKYSRERALEAFQKMRQY